MKRLVSALAVFTLLASTGCTQSSPNTPARSPVGLPSPSSGTIASPPPPSPAASASATARLPLHEGAVLSVAVSPSGDMIASGGADGKVCLTRTSDRKTGVTVRHGAPVDDVAFDGHGQTLVTVGGGMVRRWAVADGHPLSQLKIKDGLVILAPDGSTVAAVEEARVSVWDTASGRLLRNGPLRSRRLKRKVVSGAFSADGTYLVLAGSEQADEGGPPYAQTWMVVLSVGGREDAPVFGNGGTRMDGIAVTPDSKTWLMVTQGTKPVRHVYVHVGDVVQPTDLEIPAHGSLRHIVIEPNGKRFLLVDDGARLFEVPRVSVPVDDPSATPGPLPASQPQARFDLGGGLQAAAFTSDRSLLVAGGSDGALIFYSVP